VHRRGALVGVQLSRVDLTELDHQLGEQHTAARLRCPQAAQESLVVESVYVVDQAQEVRVHGSLRIV